LEEVGALDVARKHKYAAIVGGGDVSTSLLDHIRRASLTVAADSGAEFLLTHGVRVDVLLGDFDSCDPMVVQRVTASGCRVVRLPVKKDVTDTDAALEFVLAEGYSTAIMVGAMGGRRRDHEIANFFLVERFARRGLDVVLMGPRSVICHVSGSGYAGIGERKFAARAGDWVSLFPVTATVGGVRTAGLEYPLEDAVLERGATLGVSNRMLGPEAQVSVSDGFLMIALTRE
jgi:thiamine pyrophosphokinase